MKRLFIGTLSVLALAVFSLVGCGENKQTDTNTTNEATASDADISAAAASNENEMSTTDIKATASDAELPELSEETKALLGTLTDNVYTNETIGFSINAPEGWTALPPEEIQKMAGNTGLVDGGMIVFYAFPGSVANVNGADTNSMMISVEKTPADSDLKAAFQEQKEYYDSLNQQFVASQSAGEEVPSITKNEVTEWEDGTRKFYQLDTKMEMMIDGKNESQQIVTLVVDSGDYIVAVIQSSGDEENRALMQKSVDSLQFTK